MKFDFSALNLEILDLNINAFPDIFVNVNCVTFSRRVLEDMGYPQYVQCLLDAENRVFGIRACKGNESRAYRFSKPKGEQKATVSIGSRNLMEPIRRCMKNEWTPDKRYKITGFWVAEAKTMCFDLSEGVQEDYRKDSGADEEEE